MKLISKQEAYLYSIYILNHIEKKYSNEKDIFSMVETIIQFVQVCLENHEQNANIVAKIVEDFAINFSDKLDLTAQFILKKLSTAVLQNTYQQSDLERWENPLGRRFESQIQIELLENPTKAMMSSVKKISWKIIDILESKNTFQKEFMCNLTQYSNFIAFGSYKTQPDYIEVKKILLENDSINLAKIMYIHFKFSRDVMPRIRIEEHHKALCVSFFNVELKMFGSNYYLDRGRAGEIREIYTNKMGLLINDVGLYNEGLPYHESTWVSDSKAQRPNFLSTYPKKLTGHDIPYVAGPSGMTSRFMAQMLAFNVLETIEEKKYYVAAVTAYMVSAGFHSLHEVIGPIAFCLPEENLIPEYNETGNFHAFYEGLIKIDPGFLSVFLNGWRKLNDFISNSFVPACSDRLPSFSVLEGDIKIKIIEGIKNFQNKKTGLRRFNFNFLKSREIKIAENYLMMISNTSRRLPLLIMTYALLSSIDDSEALRNCVLKSLYCDSSVDARNFVQFLVHDELNNILKNCDAIKINFYVESLIFELNVSAVSKIIKCVNTGCDYKDIIKMKDYSEALDFLKAIEDRRTSRAVNVMSA